MEKTIVLAHGVLGFGAIPGLSMFVNYFNAVADHLGRQGHQVSAPSVAPLGSIAARAKKLAEAILGLPAKPKVHILAHSMGGLDARHAITHEPGVAARVATLVTIGTPHRGSPVADAIVRGSGPLVAVIPPIVAAQLRRNPAALHDLTTTAGQAFDVATPDQSGVRYIEVAGDAVSGSHPVTLSWLAQAIFRITGQINDGFVTKSSALLDGRQHLDDWPVDHFGEVGWSIRWFPVPIPVPLRSHLARYDAIVNML